MAKYVSANFGVKTRYSESGYFEKKSEKPTLVGNWNRIDLIRTEIDINVHEMPHWMYTFRSQAKLSVLIKWPHE